MEVISASDYIVDLGPHGGNDNGDIIAYGSAVDLLESNRGYTQQYLKEFNGGE